MNQEENNEAGAVQATAEPSEVTSNNPKVEASSPPTVTQGVAGDTPPPRQEEDEGMEATSEVPPNVAPSPSSTPLGGTVIQASGAPDPKAEYEEELLLKWDDHHKSFFELAEDLCHQEQFIGKILFLLFLCKRLFINWVETSTRIPNH